MGPGEAVSAVLRSYVRFDGRASRSEYWWFWVVCWGGIWLLAVLASAFSRSAGMAVSGVLGIGWLLLILPTLAVFVRRLHDSGRSGWWWAGVSLRRHRVQ